MRKKYLSALLFGALLFASTGTFTSCKDYDDDIKNLQGQIDANADAIKALQDLVNNGDYVNGVEKTADGIVFSFSKSGDKTIALEDKVGSVVEVKDGVLYIDGEATEIKVADTQEPGEEETAKDQVIIENNMWSVLQEDGSYKSTGIPVSGVTAVENAKKQWVLTIYNADGSKNEVVVPSAASVMSDLVLAGWISENDFSKELSAGAINTLEDNEKLEVKYCWLSAIKKANYGTIGDEITWSAQKEVKKGQVLNNLAANNTNLVTRVAPADLDLSGMSFTLQDSKGNTLPIGLTAAKNFTGTLTRAANSSINTILLDVIPDTYANAGEYTKLFQGVSGEGKDIKSNVLYSLVETSGARSNYGISNVVPVPYTELGEPVVTGVNPEGTIVSGTTGKGTEKEPFILDLNTPTRLVFNSENEVGIKIPENAKPDQVYDYYVEVVDKQAGEEFGFSTNIKDGTITLTKSIDLVTKTGLELYVYALRIDGQVYRSSVWVKPSSIMASAVTLKAGEQNIVPLFDKDGKVTQDGYAQFTISLDEMFANMNDTDKQRWLSSVTGANGGISISALKEAGKDFAGLDVDDDIKIEFLDKDGESCDNTKATSLLLTVKYKNVSAGGGDQTAILTPYKEYSMNVNFLHKEDEGTSVLNTVGLTLTPTLPTLSDYMTKRSVYWDGNVLMAYFNDPTSAETSSKTGYLESKFDMNYGYTKLGWTDANTKDPYCILDVNFGLDKDQKIGDVSVLDATKGMKDITNKGCNVNEITLGTVTEAGKKPFGYGEELNVLVGATYLGVYDYSKFETTKAQLADAAYKIKVQSALEAGTIKPANGASITLTPSGASQMMEITADDVNATAYNLDAPYNIFKDVVTKDGNAAWGYNYINDVEFATPDELVYQVVDADGNAGKSANAIDPVISKGAITAESYVSLKGRNTTDGQETTIKVTVTDWYGYTKTVDLPVIIKKANTGDAE